MNKGVIAILVLFVLLLCGGMGYYLIDSKIDLSADSVNNKTENWCIKINDVSKAKIKGDAISNKNKVDGNSIKFDASFEKKDDTVEYDFQIENCGSYDAYFFASSIDGISDDDKDKLTYLIEGIDDKDIIESGDLVNVKLKVKSNVDEKMNYDLAVRLDFTKVN